jgi:hypothetical protein
VTIPIIDTSKGISLASVDSVSASIDDARAKQAAQEEFKRRNSPPEVVLSIQDFAGIVEFYTLKLKDGLEDVASANGDQLITNYTNALALVHGQDNADFGMAKNTSFNLKVYFRKVNDAGGCNWEIYDADGPLFMGSFSGDKFSGKLIGSGDFSWAGTVSDLAKGKTNLFGALTWLVGVEKSKRPFVAAK